MNRLLNWIASVALAFAATVTSVPLHAQTPAVRPSDRVVRNVVVRAQPSATSAPVGSLQPGETAQVEEEFPGWYHVRLANGVTGYVSKAWTVALGQPITENLGTTGTYKLHVIDVGTGLALFIEGPDFAMIYDAGSQDDLASGKDNRVIAYLHAVRPDLHTIDHLVLSHPHKDHLELLPDVFDAYDIRNVWDSGRINQTRGYCRFLQKVAAEPGVAYHDAIAGNATRSVTFSGSGCSGTVMLHEASQMNDQPVRLGANATMTILYRDPRPWPDPNQNSVVVRLDLGGHRLLLEGDAEAGDRKSPTVPPDADSIEGQLLVCCSAQLKAEVLVVGHHGSKTSSRVAYLDAVGAKTFIVSSGPHPYTSVVLPDQEVIDQLKSRGQVFRTDIDDDACAQNPHKIGPDADESPGGCSNVVVTVGPTGVSTAYRQLAD